MDSGRLLDREVPAGCDGPKKEGWLVMANAWHPVRRWSCSGVNGKTLRGGWNRDVAELGGGRVLAVLWPGPVAAWAAFPDHAPDLTGQSRCKLLRNHS